MPKTRIGLDVGSTAVRVAEVASGDVPLVLSGAKQTSQTSRPEAASSCRSRSSSRTRTCRSSSRRRSIS